MLSNYMPISCTHKKKHQNVNKIVWALVQHKIASEGIVRGICLAFDNAKVNPSAASEPNPVTDTSSKLSTSADGKLLLPTVSPPSEPLTSHCARN
jgi:hypothetical protein